MDSHELRLEQYRILEARRSYFGTLFWQLPGFFIAVFAVFAGLATKESPGLLRAACAAGGAVFLLVSWIAHRLKASQDECERMLADAERRMLEAGFGSVVSLPRSRRFGARSATVAALLLSGVALLLLAAYGGALFREVAETAREKPAAEPARADTGATARSDSGTVPAVPPLGG